MLIFHHGAVIGKTGRYHPCRVKSILSPERDMPVILIFPVGGEIRSVIGHGLRLRTVDMFGTCRYAAAMPKMIQLRHVPDDLHRKLKARAAFVGLPLSDYLIQEVRRVAERPTIAELRRRLTHRPSITPTVSPAKAVRMERDGR